ncbi:hypothetical protein HDU96_010708 [Phlyctochytrium bullatum]|nr:hypothetical protein HDU96_010708 [Phlyctochytrium bullatum]
MASRTFSYLKVLRSAAAGRTAKLVTTKPFPKGSELAKIEGFESVSTKRWSTVQTGEDSHIELNSDLVFMNHSCNPTVFVDTTHLRVVALKDLDANTEVSFFYPSTEWKMAEPFKCWCGAKDCIGTVDGAHAISPKILQRYQLNNHIKTLLKRTEAAAGPAAATAKGHTITPLAGVVASA